LEWYGRSVNPSKLGSLEALEALISDSMEWGWGAGSISAAVAAPGARVRLAEDADGALLGFVLARRIVELLEIDLVRVRAEHRPYGIGLPSSCIRGSDSWSWAGVHAITPTAMMHCCSRA